MMDDYKISENYNFQDMAGRKMILPRHSHPTNGGPSDSNCGGYSFLYDIGNETLYSTFGSN